MSKLLRYGAGALFLLFFLHSFTACDSAGDNEPSADRFEAASSTTNQEGVTTLQLGGEEAEVTVRTQSGDPVPGQNVDAALTQNYLVLSTTDPSGSYYPRAKTLDISEAEAEAATKAGTGANVEAAPSLAAVLTVVSVAGAMHEYTFDPPRVDQVIREDGTQEECVRGDLSDVLSAFSAFGVSFGQNLHIGSAAASKLGIAEGSKYFSYTKEIFNFGFDEVSSTFLSNLNISENDKTNWCFALGPDGSLASPLWLTRGTSEDAVVFDRDFDLRVTLEWGENPRDLDAHLWTPSIQGEERHVWFANMGSLNSPPFAELDVDDTQSFGPENIRISEMKDGEYEYAVHHYAGEGTVTTSDAKVAFTGGGGERFEFEVPDEQAGDNYWWRVASISGAGPIEVTPINEITEEPPSQSSNSASLIKSSEKDSGEQ